MSINSIRTICLSFIPAMLLWVSCWSFVGAQDDVPAQENSLKVYRLRHVDAEFALQILQGVVVAEDKGKTMRIQTDQRTNSMVCYSDEKMQERIQNILRTLDEPEDAPESEANLTPPRSINLVMTLIVDGKENDWAKDALPPDGELLELLQRLPVENSFSPLIDPRIAISSVTRISPQVIHQPQQSQLIEQGIRHGVAELPSNGEIVAEGSSLAGAFHLTLKGQLSTVDSEVFSLESSINVAINQSLKTVNDLPTDPTGQARQVLGAQIETQTTIIRNHPVLLSLTAIEGRNCLIIIELN